MRTEVKFFTFSGVFSLCVASAYWFTSYDRTGTVLLLFMFLAPIFLSSYLAYRAWGLNRSEDDPRAEPGAGSGAPVGRFHTASLWPFVMALGLGVAAVGFVFGIWVVVAGAALFLSASVGLLKESRG